MLLDDIESSAIIEVAKDCTIHLNGHKLSFATEKHLDITSGNVTINGTVPGSEITKTATNEVSEYLVVASTALHIIGGTCSIYGAVKAGVAIRGLDNTDAEITMSNCHVEVKVSGSGSVHGARFPHNTFIDNCIFDVENSAGTAIAAYARQKTNGTYTFTMRNATVKAKGYNKEVHGVFIAAPVAVFENCAISAIAPTHGSDSYGIELYKDCKDLSVTNCHIEADGHTDISKDPSGVDMRGAAAIANASTEANITINGGDYWGAREALAIKGTIRINGGIFKGCAHGNYITCADFKAKNAVFRNVVYRGECGWDVPNPDGSANWHGGALYCGGSAEEPTSICLDNCRLEIEDNAEYRLVAKYTDASVYVSNIVMDGNATKYDFRADAPNVIYIGKNVNANNGDYVTAGHVDTKTYTDKEFGFETETTADNAILCVKDERGNWVAVC